MLQLGQGHCRTFMSMIVQHEGTSTNAANSEPVFAKDQVTAPHLAMYRGAWKASRRHVSFDYSAHLRRD